MSTATSVWRIINPQNRVEQNQVQQQHEKYPAFSQSSFQWVKADPVSTFVVSYSSDNIVMGLFAASVMVLVHLLSCWHETWNLKGELRYF